MTKITNTGVSPISYRPSEAPNPTAQSSRKTLASSVLPVRRPSIEDLPPEILRGVLLLLNRKDLNSAQRVNHYFRNVGNTIPTPYIKVKNKDQLREVISNFEGRKIHTLELSGGDFTDEDLQQLSASLSIQHLKLDHCYGVTDAGLAHLSMLIQLQHLNLNGCPITNAGLVHLRTLIQLQHLDIIGTRRVDDAGLVHLSTLEQLQRLYLGGSFGFTDAGVERLRTLLPQLRYVDQGPRHAMERMQQGLLGSLSGLGIHLTPQMLNNPRYNNF